MIGQSLKTITKKAALEDGTVVYNLIFKNAMYSVECYVEGSDYSVDWQANSLVRDRKNYCYIEDITEDEGEAETFLKQMVKGKVLPVHMKDMAEDYFGK